MASYRIRGLAKLVSAMITLCKIVDVFGPSIRQFVPEGSLAAYDSALTAITSSCDVIRGIAYMDTSGGTNPPWGRH